MGDKKVIAYERSYRLIDGGRVHEDRGTIFLGVGMSASRVMELYQQKMDRTWGTTTALKWKVCENLVDAMTATL